MLSHWKVLDLTDRRGELAAFVLGELGAEVTKVEVAAQAGERRDVARFAAYNANKRSVALDPAEPPDRAVLDALVADADVVFDCGPPGVLAAFGLGPAELEARNASLVTVVVSAFGLDGPRADQPFSEVTVAALGGPLRLQGTPDRPPVQMSVPQVWRHTGAEAAVAAMVGHARMLQTGRAQFIDVSAQSVMTWTMLNAMEAFAIQGRDFERTGSVLRLATDLAICHAAADGYVIAVPRGEMGARLLPWLVEEGLVGPAWSEEDWSTFDHRSIVGEPTLVTTAELTTTLAALCARHPKQRLLLRGLELGVTIAPLNEVADLLEFVQLEARRFFVDAEVDGVAVRRPGVAMQIDGRRAEAARVVPAFDQHGAERRAAAVRARTARPQQAPVGGELPFSGLKVADFSWIGVGPITTKCLADHGATVVRVESDHRRDGLRVQPPMRDAVFGLNRSNFYGAFNTSKLGLALDLKSEGSRVVVRRLVAWADVVVDSFTPGVMSRLGLGPQDIRAINPAVITLNTSLLGTGGPHSAMAGYGYHAAALAGFFALVGWPDLPPDGPWLAYTDTIGPRLITPTLLAALDHRRRTGQGVHLEAAQLELALHFLSPELIEHQLDGFSPSRVGNRQRDVAPQGVYPCRGTEEWCAITVTDDEAWQRLVRAMGSPAWVASLPGLDTLAGRLAAHDRLDEELARWTIGFEAAELEARLCEVGVAAGALARSRDLLADPQYAHRRFYAYLPHTECGPTAYAGHQYRIAGYDHGPRSAAPCLGEHTFEVLTELLGFTVDEVADIAATGALE